MLVQAVRAGPAAQVKPLWHNRPYRFPGRFCLLILLPVAFGIPFKKQDVQVIFQSLQNKVRWNFDGQCLQLLRIFSSYILNALFSLSVVINPCNSVLPSLSDEISKAVLPQNNEHLILICLLYIYKISFICHLGIFLVPVWCLWSLLSRFFSTFTEIRNFEEKHWESVIINDPRKLILKKNTKS